MINPNELRRLNVVNIPKASEGKPFIVRVIFFKTVGFHHEVLPTFYWIEDLEPIPLTQKLLVEACGMHHHVSSDRAVDYFIVRQDPQLKGDSEWRFALQWVRTQSNPFMALDHPSRRLNILYLHQLQNIFFAITGEEMEIKVEALK